MYNMYTFLIVQYIIKNNHKKLKRQKSKGEREWVMYKRMGKDAANKSAPCSLYVTNLSATCWHYVGGTSAARRWHAGNRLAIPRPPVSLSFALLLAVDDVF